MQQTHVTQRFWEIDTMRGVAICMMVLFHTLFDLTFLGVAAIQVSTGFWRYFAYVTAFLFVFLVGVSLTISSAHARKVLSPRAYYLKYIRRGLFIFGLGLAVTLVTWIIIGPWFIRFGILHLIGISIILSIPFLRFRWINLVAGILVIIAGEVVHTIRGPDWLLPLGIHSPTFYSVDYTPLLPWFGVVLLGIFLGNLAYPDGKRRCKVPDLKFPLRNGLVFLGRHSLAIYVIHQPVIILLIMAVTGTRIL
ncbi:putative membrane protein [Methanolinea mesophila]|uniref:heparan-alpha-glucosaminide N-acetyltransferase n=1 Tax=Methanolinea mesophila TaxID=547055 RepID=UPI001AE45839|nr:heparan-alpha-glucosaminide N-acetyltransferase [Methanolinea mesophila]MBP1928012.1 putative membrane protein [Methanolinea mesophila]